MKILITLFSMVLLVACTRDHTAKPSTPVVSIDSRLKFVGLYDVYDTMSNWLYEMEITLHPGTGIDSLRIVGWGGDFDVHVQHHRNDGSNFLHFIGGFGMEDYENHRWALYSEYDSAFNYNRIVNDTLRLSYLKDNIAFYVQDGVPYFSGHYREYAVKRDWE